MIEKKKRVTRKETKVRSLQICKDLIGDKVYKELKAAGLEPREIKFCAIYTHTLDVVEAYQQYSLRGVTEKTAYQSGNALLQIQHIKKAINMLINRAFDALKPILKKEIIETLRLRAFYDVAAFVNEDGTAKKINEIDKSLRKSVIDGVERKHYGKDGNEIETVLKLANRDKALTEIIAIINLINKVENNTVIGINAEAQKTLINIFSARKDNNE